MYKHFDVPESLFNASKLVLEANQDAVSTQVVDARKVKGGKTKVEINPELNPDSTNDTKKTVKETVLSVAELEKLTVIAAKLFSEENVEEPDQHKHPITQLQKIVSTNGGEHFHHVNGQKTKMNPQMATHALKLYNAHSKPTDKDDFARKLHHSHESMKSTLS